MTILSRSNSELSTVEFAPNEVIIKLKDTNSSEDNNSLQVELGATVSETTQQLGLQLWTVSGLTVEEAIEVYRNDPRVEYIEPNYIVQNLINIPNDPNFNQLWGLNNTGQTGGKVDADIDAPEIWDVTTGGNAIVGVIDSGVDYTHPDLNNNIWINPGESGSGKETNGIDDDGNGYIDDFRGWDFVNNDNNPIDDHFHGTHVAGTIGAEGYNGIGVVGVNWDVQIMPLKFLAGNGMGSTFNAIRAVEYATLKGADLTNNSWGGGGFSQGLFNAIAAGPLFVASAGNSGLNTDNNPHSPSSYNLNNIISVAATDHNDKRGSFSNFGVTSVDLGAPGVNILSTFPTYTTPAMSAKGFSTNYESIDGTSMAAPHVAGVAASIVAGRRAIGKSDLTDIQLRQFILDNVDPINALNGITVTGGRLNANIATRTGIGWGDVHLVTFDGRAYDLQSFGEFILAETARDGDSWVVQTRQEPWVRNDLVSVNTAFATDVDGLRVVFDLDFSNKLQIDGIDTPISSGETLTIGNSQIQRTDNVYTLTYAGDDGIVDSADAQLIARDQGDHINIEISHFGRLQGLLGNNDGNPDNDFSLRNGTQLSSNPSIEQLHGEYADSWRLLAGESLFVAPEEPPSPLPPVLTPPRLITLDDLDPQAVRAAREMALEAEIPEGDILDAVAFDLAATHDINFLNGAVAIFAPEAVQTTTKTSSLNDFTSNLVLPTASTNSTVTVENETPLLTVTTIEGTNQADQLTGTSEDEVFVGLLGRDMLTGNGGDDIFAYNSLAEGGDIITDFSSGDLIDISLVLEEIGYNGTDALADQYVRFLGRRGMTTVQIDVDGLGTSLPRDFVLVQGVDVETLSNPDNFIF